MAASEQDSLEYLPLEKWPELQAIFMDTWPRGISAYYALETQKEWKQIGIDHDFKVYCPFGDMSNGMVAFNKKSTFNEIIIQCPKDDTIQLEEALKRTKLIDWSTSIIVPFTPSHITHCIGNILGDVNMKIAGKERRHEIFILDKRSPLYENISLHEGITFKPLLKDHIHLVDSSWVNRYDSSAWYIDLLITSKSGFGLFKGDQLACWLLVNEVGALTHLFTLPEHRKKGYAETLLKLVCNNRLKDNKDSFAYCMTGNVNASNLYNKLGFVKFHTVIWRYLLPRTELN
ncbi:uncharacterized protein LOC113521689 [Galleria mellonella]|uniref:Uncharacterized protein LOC113521689 n=1 Tax=Galleria mellonella TaxID=7137 RepID=A0A6J1X7X1_GALME|nr:uncharacterized protein LOC113521689 [Galleria mellonella]XP_031765881.1 uncharacterized protein LOC113521689 [Galleria mellonella]